MASLLNPKDQASLIPGLGAGQLQGQPKATTSSSLGGTVGSATSTTATATTGGGIKPGSLGTPSIGGGGLMKPGSLATPISTESVRVGSSAERVLFSSTGGRSKSLLETMSQLPGPKVSLASAGTSGHLGPTVSITSSNLAGPVATTTTTGSGLVVGLASGLGAQPASGLRMGLLGGSGRRPASGVGARSGVGAGAVTAGGAGAGTGGGAGAVTGVGAEAGTGVGAGAGTGSGAGTGPAAIKKHTYRELEDLVNRWSCELQHQERIFLHQAGLVGQWDSLLQRNGERIITLNEQVETIQTEQKRLDNELDLLDTQQNELEEVLSELEQSLTALPQLSSSQHADTERNYTYSLVKRIDSQLAQMGKDLTDVIEQMNAANPSDQEDDHMRHIIQILNAHADTLNWIDQNTALVQQKVEEVSAMADKQRLDHERSLHMTFGDSV